MSEPTRPCSNCRAQIPESKLDLHEGFCMRNNIKCNRCGNYYDKNDPESHEEEFHQKQQCPHCKQDFQDLSKHNCSKKPIPCLHCGLEFQKDQLYQHENVCGSRTQKCSICNKPIMLRDLAKHENTCVILTEEIPKYQEPPQAKPSRNEIFDKPIQQEKKLYEQKQEQKQNPYQRQQQPLIEKKSYDPPKQDNFLRQDSQTTKTTKYSYPQQEKPSSQKQLSDFRHQQPNRQPVTVVANQQKEQIKDYRQQQQDKPPQQQPPYNYGQPSYQQQQARNGSRQESYNQQRPSSDKDLYKKQDSYGYQRSEQDKYGLGQQRQDSQKDKYKQNNQQQQQQQQPQQSQQYVSRFQQQQESKPTFDSKYEQKQYQQNKYDKYDKVEPYQRQLSNNRPQPKNEEYRNPPVSQPKPPSFDPYDQRKRNEQQQQPPRQNLVRPDTAIAREIQEQINLEELGLTEEEMELQRQLMDNYNKKPNQPPQQQNKPRQQDYNRRNNQVPEQIYNNSDINNGFGDEQINYAELGYTEEDIRMQQQIFESMNSAQQSNKNKNPTKKYYNH